MWSGELSSNILLFYPSIMPAGVNRAIPITNQPWYAIANGILALSDGIDGGCFIDRVTSSLSSRLHNSSELESERQRSQSIDLQALDDMIAAGMVIMRKSGAKEAAGS